MRNDSINHYEYKNSYYNILNDSKFFNFFSKTQHLNTNLKIKHTDTC